MECLILNLNLDVCSKVCAANLGFYLCSGILTFRKAPSKFNVLLLFKDQNMEEKKGFLKVFLLFQTIKKKRKTKHLVQSALI